MWITHEETIKDLHDAFDRSSLDTLNFFNVEFSKEIFDVFQQFKRRRVKKIRLMGCRGVLETVLAFLLKELQIEELILCGIRLDLNLAKEIGNGLVTAPTLKCLHLQDLMLSSHLIEALQYGILRCQSLDTLVWNNHTFMSTDEVKQVISMFTNAKRLKKLEIWNHFFEDAQIAELLMRVKRHPCLVQLRVSVRKLSNVYVAIEDLCRSSQSKLTSLQFGINGPWEKIQNLPSNGRISYSIEPKLTKNEDMESLGTTLLQNPHIVSLDLANNGLTDRGIANLSTSLARAKGLKQLCISRNIIGKTGAEALLMAMESNMFLNELFLPYHCDLKSRIQLFVDLNKAGRRLQLDHKAPLSLWPLVLERANRSLSKESSFSKISEGRSASVIYHLLQSQIGLRILGK